MNENLREALNAFAESPQPYKNAAVNLPDMSSLDSLSNPLPDPADKIDNRLVITNKILQQQLNHAISEAESAKKEARFAKGLSILSIIIAVVVPFTIWLLEYTLL